MTNSKNNQQILRSTSPLTLRWLLGLLGVTLPPILYLGNAYIYDVLKLRGSLSKYYYTGMRDVFVGYLVAMGLFLIAYQGYERKKSGKPWWKDPAQYIGDRRAGLIAGICAISVALFPTVADGIDETDWVNEVHYVATLILYLTLSYFCLFLFPIYKGELTKGTPKYKRNQIYRWSGILMLVSIVASGVISRLDPDLGSFENPTFWFESLTNTIFGIAWVIKGGGLSFLVDDKDRGKRISQKKWDVILIIAFFGLYIWMIWHSNTK